MKHAHPSNTHRFFSSLLLTAAMCLGLGLASTATADEIQTNNLWIPNATIQNITGGEIIYITNLGSEVSIPMTRVQAIKVPAYPDLWEAQQAIDAKKDSEALPLLLKLQGLARQDWLKNHAAWMAVHVMDRLGRTTQAVEGYLALAREKPDDFYMQRPPLSSLAAASDVQKKDLAQRLKQAAGDFDGVTRAAILEMIKRLAVAADPAAPGQPGQTPDKPADGATPASPVTPGTGIVDANDKVTNTTGVVFSTYLVAADRDPVSPLLLQGKWQEAVDKCNELLAGRETRMSMRLYQLGIAQLQLAEKTGREDDYKDAGLSLSRSVIYFPSSSIAGPGLVELGYIHTKIGRTDLALKLWDKARLQVDETQDPDVFSRLEKLIAQATSSSGQDTPEN